MSAQPEWRRVQQACWLKKGQDVPLWVFPARQGGLLKERNVRHVCTRLLAKATLRHIITVDTYRHLIPGANRRAVNRVDDDAATQLSATRRNRICSSTTSTVAMMRIYWEKVVSRIFASWNQLDRWLRQIETLIRAA